MDPNTAQHLAGEVADGVWYLVLTFWTVSGAFSTLSMAMPTPLYRKDTTPAETDVIPTHLPTPGTVTVPATPVAVPNKFLTTKTYLLLYNFVNAMAQNLRWARNLNDPHVRVILNTTVRSVITALAAGTAAPAVANLLKGQDASSDPNTENKP